MKKTLIIALLIALVLGVFTACDGEVNADMSGGTKIITLELYNANWYFTETGTDTMELEIPSDCRTWADLEAKGSIISVTQSGKEASELTLSHYTDYEDQKTYAHYFHEYGSYAISAAFHPIVGKSFTPTLISSDIDSENYKVYIDIWEPS